MNEWRHWWVCVQSEDVALLKQEIQKGEKFLGRIRELLSDCLLFAKDKVVR